MNVSDDFTSVKSLRCGVIGDIWICKRSGNEVVDLQLDIETFIGFEIFYVFRACYYGRDHVIKTWNIAHCYERLTRVKYIGGRNLRIGLQDPSRFCKPLVKVCPSQASIKLFWLLKKREKNPQKDVRPTDVSERAWPALTPLSFWPWPSEKLAV